MMNLRELADCIERGRSLAETISSLPDEDRKDPFFLATMGVVGPERAPQLFHEVKAPCSFYNRMAQNLNIPPSLARVVHDLAQQGLDPAAIEQRLRADSQTAPTAA